MSSHHHLPTAWPPPLAAAAAVGTSPSCSPPLQLPSSGQRGSISGSAPVALPCCCMAACLELLVVRSMRPLSCHHHCQHCWFCGGCAGAGPQSHFAIALQQQQQQQQQPHTCDLPSFTHHIHHHQALAPPRLPSSYIALHKQMQLLAHWLGKRFRQEVLTASPHVPSSSFKLTVPWPLPFGHIVSQMTSS